MDINDENIIQVRIKTAAEMGFLGGAFGAKFLYPLVNGRSAGPRGLVVALYGMQNVGKSTFAEKACAPFVKFYDISQAVSPYDKIMGVSYGTPHRLFRMKDYGLDGFDIFNQSRGIWYIPRSELFNGTAPKAGFDLLEHPPMRQLDKADIICVFGATKDTSRFSSVRYFTHPLHDPDLVLSNCKNPKAKEIAQAMIKAHEALITPNADLSSFSIIGALTHTNKMSRLTKGQRFVSLILANDNEVAKRKFTRLKKFLALTAT